MILLRNGSPIPGSKESKLIFGLHIVHRCKYAVIYDEPIFVGTVILDGRKLCIMKVSLSSNT